MLSRTLQRRFITTFYEFSKLSSIGCIKNEVKSPVSSARVPQCSYITPRWYTQNATMDTVDFDYVKKATNEDSTLIIDVREPDEIREHGKIPNSVNIPLSNVTSALSAQDKEFMKMFKRPKPKEDTEIIFYCMIGKRSANAQKNAIKLGFKNSKNYLGSWNDWAAKTK